MSEILRTDLAITVGALLGMDPAELEGIILIGIDRAGTPRIIHNAAKWSDLPAVLRAVARGMTREARPHE